MATLDKAPDPLASGQGEMVPRPTPRPTPPPASSAPAAPAQAEPQETDAQQTEEVTVSGQRKDPFTRNELGASQERLRMKVEAVDKETNALQPPKQKFYAPPNPKTTNPVEVWGSTAMLLAGIGSLMTRAPLTTALNAAAGVMNAYKKNDIDEANRQWDQWKFASQEADKQHQFEQEAYKTALTKAHNNKEDAIAEAKSYAEAFKDDAMATAAANKDTAMMQRLLNDRARNNILLARYQKQIVEGKIANQQFQAITQSEEYKKATPEQQAQMLLQMTPAGMVPQNVVASMALNFNKTNRLPYGLPKELKTRVLAEAGRQQAVKNMSPEDVLADQTSFAANKVALAQLEKQRQAGSAFERVTRKNMATAERLMGNKINPSSLGPYLNKWIMTGKIESGDANTPAYVTAFLTVANEYAKVMSGSTGAAAATEGARHEAEEALNGFLNSDQIRNTFALMRKDMNNKTSGYFEQSTAIKQEMAHGAIFTADDIKSAIRSDQNPDGWMTPEEGLEMLQERFPDDYDFSN